MDRQFVIDEIRRIAAENGGKPPGMEKFRRESGIPKAQWLGVHWVNWSDALTEAGFQPNSFAAAIDKKILLGILARATRDFKKLPTDAEFMFYMQGKKDFPNPKAFQRHFPNKGQKILALKNYCEQNNEFADVILLLPDISEIKSSDQISVLNSITNDRFGYVYLLKFRRNDYKIGASNNPERRFGEIATKMPEPPLQIHTIKTDDPFGVEAYWHRRFASKQIDKDSEWFQLSAADVRAFRRWTRIF
jgi:hypothetical protein